MLLCTFHAIYYIVHKEHELFKMGKYKNNTSKQLELSLVLAAIIYFCERPGTSGAHVVLLSLLPIEPTTCVLK
jgi:hypothetical protein